MPTCPIITDVLGNNSRGISLGSGRTAITWVVSQPPCAADFNSCPKKPAATASAKAASLLASDGRVSCHSAIGPSTTN
jgi:hypothetical protein